MATRRKYVFNPTTFMYEIHEEPKSHRIIRTVVFVVVGVGLAWFYFWLYTSVLGLELPKTVRLKKIHARWESKMDVLNRRIDVYDITLKGIEDRDDDVYRSIYGLDPIPDEIKMAGYGGVNRYGYLDDFGASPYLKSTLKRLDVMTKRSYLQSRSLDAGGRHDFLHTGSPSFQSRPRLIPSLEPLRLPLRPHVGLAQVP